MKVASGSSNGYSEVSQTPYNIGNDEPYPLSSGDWKLIRRTI